MTARPPEVPRPSYQNGVARITGSRMRSAPDITMDPAALGLRPGHHVLTLQGMLITTASFHS